MKRCHFLARYWHILLGIAALVLVVFNNTVFQWLGPLVYLPLLCLGVMAMALTARNILHRNTTEPYIRTGEYDNDFEHMPHRDKVWLTAIQYFVYLAAFAHIAASLMR